jgi:hypothetical protein
MQCLRILLYVSLIFLNNTVACTAAAMQWLQERRRRTALSEQQLCKTVTAATNTHAKIEKRCFIYGLCREVITRRVGGMC